jgi:hypothetical protein
LSLKSRLAITLGFIVISSLGAQRGALAGDTALTASLTVKGQYATNAGFDASGGERDDVITTASPQVMIVHRTRKGTINANYGLNSSFYSRHDDLNRTSHSGALLMSLQLSERTTVTAGDSVRYVPDSLGSYTTGVLTGRSDQSTPDPADTGRTGIRTVRTDEFANTLTLGMSRTLSERTSLTVSLADAIIEFEDPGMIDTRTDSAALKLTHSLSPGRSLNMDYSYTRFTFGSGSGTNIDTHALSMGITETFSPVLTASLSAGANYTPEPDDRFDWNAAASLQRSFKRSSLDIGYARRVTSSSGVSDTLNINESYKAAYNQTITKTLSMSLSADYAVNMPGASSGVDSSSVAAGISGVWKPALWVTADMGYNYFTQWTDSTSVAGLSSDSYFANAAFTPIAWKPFSASVGYTRFTQRSDSASVTELTNDTYFLSVTLAPAAWRL